jgi:hypothetical protein
MATRYLTSYCQRCLIGALVILAITLMALIAHAADVNLAWDASASPGVTGYTLHHGSVSGTYTTTRDVGNVTTGTVTGLTPGQRYFFAVRAYDGFGQTSAFSTELAHTVPLPAPPEAPTNLRVLPSNPAPAAARGAKSPAEGRR